MKAWIDNSSLHGAGRCISGDAKNAYDTRNLFQIASAIIFAENAEIAASPGDQIFESTQEFIDLMSRYGVNERFLSNVETGNGAYAQACIEAAELASDQTLITTAGEYLNDHYKLDQPNDVEYDYKGLTELITSDSETFLSDSAERAMALKGTGAIHLMIARCPRLKETLAHLHANGLWTRTSSYHLSAYLRTLLNLELGRSRSATYLPTSSRADLLLTAQARIEANRNRMYTKRPLDEVIDELIVAAGPTDFLPKVALGPIATHLLRVSKGEPNGIIAEAVKLRDALAPIRRDEKKLDGGLATRNSTPSPNAQRMSKNISDLIGIKIGKMAPPNMSSVARDALAAVALTFGIPIKPGLEIENIRDSAGHLIRKKRYFALADMGYTYFCGNVTSEEFDYFLSRAFRNML